MKGTVNLNREQIIKYPKKSVKLSKDTKECLDELIRIKVGTHEHLTRRGRKGDSYNDIIMDLIHENGKLKLENNRLERELQRLKEQ